MAGFLSIVSSRWSNLARALLRHPVEQSIPFGASEWIVNLRLFDKSFRKEDFCPGEDTGDYRKYFAPPY